MKTIGLKVPKKGTKTTKTGKATEKSADKAEAQQ